MKLPADKAGLTLEHNPHKGGYTPLTEWLRNHDMCPRDEKTAFADISDEELAKCLAEDEIWVLQWYPAGFIAVAASTLEGVLKAAEDLERQ